MDAIEGKFQIGKNGVNEGVIESINLALKNHKSLRISVLKSSGRNKDSIKEIAENIEKSVEYQCHSKIIGFTIILRKKSNKLVKKSKSNI